jgi:hypothetical protein
LPEGLKIRAGNLSVNPYLAYIAALGMSSKTNFDPRFDPLYPEETKESEDTEGITGDVMKKRKGRQKSSGGRKVIFGWK